MPVLDLESGQFHYHIDDFSDPWLRREPVLLHHAAGGNLHRWRAWVPALARRQAGHQVRHAGARRDASSR